MFVTICGAYWVCNVKGVKYNVLRIITYYEAHYIYIYMKREQGAPCSHYMRSSLVNITHRIGIRMSDFVWMMAWHFLWIHNAWLLHARQIVYELAPIFSKTTAAMGALGHLGHTCLLVFFLSYVDKAKLAFDAIPQRAKPSLTSWWRRNGRCFYAASYFCADCLQMVLHFVAKCCLKQRDEKRI